MTQGGRDDRKRIGRPLKNPEQGKRLNVMFRLGEARKDQLMQAAEISGRSMSEEIEKRIEESFVISCIDNYLEWERENFSAQSELRRLEGMCGGRENFEFSWFIGEKLRGIRMKLGIKADTPINDVPEQDRRRMMEELITALPLRFGVFDTE
ncbi:hypothetical protein [Methylobacterium goesingense]|uniref:Ribbon-helix-helix protein CopG domain-containing protein n=1 Tax=Methylobacterium goesingense TaxID=243690 RepID=A0ABV2LC32_9HYPH|nr:hypothetical protein [Methylobacterium goesingense]